MSDKVYNKKQKPKYKWYKCEDCGKPVLKRVRCDRHKLCTDCAIRRMTRACMELHLEKVSKNNEERRNKNDRSDGR
jgi:DNA-directed RNA polymerase subunit RPC12/RpoP